MPPPMAPETTDPESAMNAMIHSGVRRFIRTNSAALVAAICMAAFPAAAFDSSPYPDGTAPDGSAAHPWKVDQPEDLNQIGSDGVHGPGACYLMVRNLDCRNEDHRVRSAFSGVFDGNYRIVSRIRVDQPSEIQVGLFSNLHDGALVKRVAVVASSFRAAGAMGGLVGSMQYGSTVEECYSWGNTVIALSTTQQAIGGITGGESYQRPAAVVRNCFARNNTMNSAFQTVGGICGYNDAFVEKCYAAGSSLTAPRYVGGVIGYGGSGTVVDSYSDLSNSPPVQCGSSYGTWLNSLVPDRFTTNFNITSHPIAELGWDPAVWSIGPDGYPWLTGFNLPPVAVAGPGRDVSLGSTAYLDGGSSADDHTPRVLLTYEWSIESAPAGSAAGLVGPNAIQPMFMPDLPGVYTIKLTVTDEDGLADDDTTTLDVRPVLAGGSFEDDFAGWTCTGNVSIQSGPPYASTDGGRLVAFNDRNTVPNGVLSQVVETVPGMVYRLRFDVGVLSYVNKQQRLGLEVSNGAVLLADTITLTGATGGKVTWQSKDYRFTANGNSASIIFRDLSPWTNGIDLLLDHVRITSTALPMQVVSEPGPGVGIEVSPADVPGDGDGTTGFQRIYNPGSVVELLALETFGSSSFFNWLKDGAHLDTDRWVEVTMDDAHLMTAVYWGGEPIITEQPVDATALEDGTAEFRVVASGGVPLDFQWRFEGSDIAGANSPVLAIDPVSPADVGNFDVVVSNAYGTETSAVVSLAIEPSFAGLENGGFESDFQGWTVSGNLAVSSDAAYLPTEGVKLVVFNSGNRVPNGVLFQVFDTTPGQPYVLSFDMGVLAYNTRAQSLEVEVTGSPSLVSDTFTMNGAGGGKIVWQHGTLSFTADSPRTTVSFRDLSPSSNSIDLLLDNVAVNPVIMRTLTVEGTPVGGVYVEFTPPDEFGGTWFWTDFSRNYPEGTEITLSAVDPYITSTYPSKGLEYRFQRWLMDGAEIGTDPEVTFALDGDRTLTAVYEEAPPVILTQPEDVVATLGGSAWFHVECRPYGYGAFQSCQWRFNGIPIPGETTNSLLIDPVGVEHVGTYDVVVYNSSGASLVSDSVTLTLATGSLANGSFESDFDGWQTHGNVRVQNGSPAPDGIRIAAFNSGNTVPGGGVSQTFLTEPGRYYSMRFELGLLSYVVGWQEMEVTVEGNWIAASRTFRMSRTSAREPTTRWETMTVNFVANGPETTITFRDASLSTNGIDLLLDHIRLEPPDPLLVTTLVDEMDGSLGQGAGDSLREALAEAEARPGAALIRFAPTLDGGTIVLGGDSLVVDSDVAIDATELPGGLVVSGDHSSRVFEIMEGRTVAIAGLTVTRGRLNDPRDETGAGLLNHGNLSLARVTVTDCNGIGDVGAAGGGIGNSWTGSLSLVECSVTRNGLLNGVGGGIYNGGRLIVERSTISSNSADDGGGGGIFNHGDLLQIVNSTITNNYAYNGGGGGIQGEVSLLRNTTVSGNLASYPAWGGIDGLVGVMENSIVAGNLVEKNLHDGNPTTYIPSDMEAPLETRGANLIGGEPMLQPLGDYGGPTETMPPASGSPAIDAAIMLATTPAVDQRGFPRPVDGDGENGAAPDIGAVERE